jgi:hypothetical protein
MLIDIVKAVGVGFVVGAVGTYVTKRVYDHFNPPNPVNLTDEQFRLLMEQSVKATQAMMDKMVVPEKL